MKTFVSYFALAAATPGTWVLAQAAQATSAEPALPWVLVSGSTVATLATLLYRQFLKVQKDNDLLLTQIRDREKEMRETTTPAILRNTVVLERIESVLSRISDTMEQFEHSIQRLNKSNKGN